MLLPLLMNLDMFSEPTPEPPFAARQTITFADSARQTLSQAASAEQTITFAYTARQTVSVE